MREMFFLMRLEFEECVTQKVSPVMVRPNQADKATTFEVDSDECSTSFEKSMFGQSYSDPEQRNISPCINQAQKRRVSFTMVELQEYAREISDNPSTSDFGPAIGLGWRKGKKVSMGFEEFELCRSINRRSRKELIIPACERRAMLREVGYSNSTIQEFSIENMLIKSQVQRTRAKVRNEPVRKMMSQVRKKLAGFSISKNPKQSKLLKRRRGTEEMIHCDI